MDFGIVTAKVDEIGYITHAENLGFSHCWVTDSQMIRSNCWAVLALAARDTRRMRLGTGVNVPGLRLAPVAANGIATSPPSIASPPGAASSASAPVTPPCGRLATSPCASAPSAST